MFQIDPIGLVVIIINTCRSIADLRGQLKANREQSIYLIERVVNVCY